MPVLVMGVQPRRPSDVYTGVQKDRTLQNGAIFICWQSVKRATDLPAPAATMDFSGTLVPPHLAILWQHLAVAEQHLQQRQLNVFAVTMTLRHPCHAQQGIIFVNHVPTELLRILTLAHAMLFWLVMG